MTHLAVFRSLIDSLRERGPGEFLVRATWWAGELLRIESIAPMTDSITADVKSAFSLVPFSLIGVAKVLGEDVDVALESNAIASAIGDKPEQFVLLLSKDRCVVVHRFDSAITTSDPSVFNLNELFARVQSLVGLDRLTKARVCVVGLGSGGSRVAWELTKSGVGSFVFIDYDRLEPANLSRHICGATQLGRLKTHAVRDMLKDYNSALEVEVQTFDVVKEPARLEAVVAGCDLLVAASGTPQSYRLMNDICIRKNKPVVFAGLWEKASAGYAMRVVPGRTACFNCVHEAILRSAPETPANLPDYSLDPDQQEIKAEPGLSTDIGFISLLQARMALLALCTSSEGSSSNDSRDELPTFALWAGQTLLVGAPDRKGIPENTKSDYLLWTNRSYKEMPPFTILRADVKRRPDCAVCNVDGWLARIASEQGLTAEDLDRARTAASATRTEEQG